MASRTERPQFYENNLEPIHIDRQGLVATLADIRAAIRQAVDTIETSHPAPDPTEKKAFGSICDGHLGIALAYLRLHHQSAYLRAEDDQSPPPDFRKLAQARINPHQLELDVLPGRPSPQASGALGAAVMRILDHHSSGVGAHKSIDKNDIEALGLIVQVALQQSPVVPFRGHSMGGDDIITGRSGLLWAISNLQHYSVDEEDEQQLDPIFGAVAKLVDAIMAAGRRGAEDFAAQHGDENALPLMWLWFDGCYGLGGMHGTTGILAILLAIIATAPSDSLIYEYLPEIARTITALSKLCVTHQGHLPMAIPDLPSRTPRASLLVQICHGTPGLLHLLALTRKNSNYHRSHWTPECDEAIRLGSEMVWREGLLSKGGGLCHGIAGNAWPWLVLHDAFEYDSANAATLAEKTETAPREVRRVISGDAFLSKAIAFLLQARQTQPFNTGSDKYRMPDKPYGLYEGLAGTVCAWAETCVVIVARLRKMDLDEEGGGKRWEDDRLLEKHLAHELGFPTLGGGRVTGFL